MTRILQLDLPQELTVSEESFQELAQKIYENLSPNLDYWIRNKKSSLDNFKLHFLELEHEGVNTYTLVLEYTSTRDTNKTVEKEILAYYEPKVLHLAS